MVAGPTQKSTYITNSDAAPRLATTAGAGGPGVLCRAEGYVIPAAADGAGTKYLLVRIPTNVYVKKVSIESEAQAAGKVQVGVYYADNIADLAGGSANAGVVVPSGVNFFANDVDLSSAVAPTDITNQAGHYTIDLRVEPLWQALGLASDPGGKFDIVATVHTTDITTGTGKLQVVVDYIEP